MMRIVVLTTETPHHAFFVRELQRYSDIALLVIEHDLVTPTFETHHPFEEARRIHESLVFFDNREISLDQLGPTLRVGRCREAAARLQQIRPQVVVVFGTARLPAEVIELCPDGMINLHGGDPERYRGLDSHLWSIYYDDFNALKVTLHRVTEKLDAGDVVLQEGVPLRSGMGLHELRVATTRLCVELVAQAIEQYGAHRRLKSRPQRTLGRYYSFMPPALKGICLDNFQAHTRGL